MTSTPDESRSGGGDWTTQHLGSTAASGNVEPDPQAGQASSAEPAPGSDRYGLDETARNPNIDPDPEEAKDPDTATDAQHNPQGPADLEPGQTPPESNSATATAPTPAPTKPPKSNVVITVAVIAAVILIGLIFFGYIAGLLD